MNCERTLIVSILLLGSGLGLLLGFCHGTVGFNAAYPASGASLQISTTTTGMPAMAGFVATVLGIILLVIAFMQALFGQAFRRSEAPKGGRTSVN